MGKEPSPIFTYLPHILSYPFSLISSFTLCLYVEIFDNTYLPYVITIGGGAWYSRRIDNQRGRIRKAYNVAYDNDWKVVLVESGHRGLVLPKDRESRTKDAFDVD